MALMMVPQNSPNHWTHSRNRTELNPIPSQGSSLLTSHHFVGHLIVPVELSGLIAVILEGDVVAQRRAAGGRGHRGDRGPLLRHGDGERAGDGGNYIL